MCRFCWDRGVILRIGDREWSEAGLTDERSETPLLLVHGCRLASMLGTLIAAVASPELFPSFVAAQARQSLSGSECETSKR